MAAAAVSSAAPLLAMLEEDSDSLKQHALVELVPLVPHYWFQISNYISTVEALCEDSDFAHRHNASLLASKVYYHLCELDEALHFALDAGQAFNIEEDSEYASTIVARAMDKYFEMRQALDKPGAHEDAKAPPAALEGVVQRVIDRCVQHKQLKQAVGICLEARRFDVLEELIQRAPDRPAILHYLLEASKSLVSKHTRNKVLELAVAMFQQVDGLVPATDDSVMLGQCLMDLNKPEDVAQMVSALLQSAEGSNRLLALQIAFDLFDNDNAAFMQKMATKLTEAKGTADEATAANFDKVLGVISGVWPIALNLQFLYWHNAADMQLLHNVKESFETRNSMCHTATVMANAFMYAGTTRDDFLRTNRPWLASATNWARFGATASLGVLHRGHLQNTVDIMKPYLPSDEREVGPYSEGGALYALGLIHANHGQNIIRFLVNSLERSSHEVIQHGACLGIGLAVQGTNDEAIYNVLKEVLYADSAVAGEAAGIAMGLLCCGTEDANADHAAEEMLSYAHETSHEKIIRGLAIGLALRCYGREENAETLIEQLSRDADPIIRFGGMFAIGMAFRGTDNNASIQRLLHFAVSDVSDDVRRAAVMNLGFVLLGVPEQCPPIVTLLSQSYNPHLRYGSAMAVGIACAGTGLKVAEDLLQPMLKDSVDFVRQGANIALALVMIQQPESNLLEFRRHLERTVSDKHEDSLCKMGAIMATGIIDAGGRNATIGMLGRTGYFRRTSILSVALFLQYWYWFPMGYALSLAFKTTALIGITEDLKLPKFEFTCNCQKSIFAYAKPVADSSKKKVAKLPTAVLSTTKKAKQRAKKKAEARMGDSLSMTLADSAGPLDLEVKDSPGRSEGGPSKRAEEAAGKEDEEPEVDDKAKEADQCPYQMDNPARVVPAQMQYVMFDANSRFEPIKASCMSGVIVLRDKTPGEPIEYIEQQSGATATAAATEAAPAAAEAPAAAAAAAPAQEPDAPQDMVFSDEP